MELIIPNQYYLKSYQKAREEAVQYNVKEYEFLDPGKSDIFEVYKV